MFAFTDTPRLFGLAPGADFATGLVAGLLARFDGHRPESLARVTLLVNTRRMQRRIRAVFDAGPPRLLPQVRLITDLGRDPVAADLPPPVAPLRRRLELAQLVGKLLDADPGLAPRATLYDLADSLADLMDEMQGEGVSPDAIAGLDVTDQSGHWARSLRFLTIVQRYFDLTQEPPDPEARQRLVIERLTADWATTPPVHPVIVAGSTGSRGATALLLAAVARLPQGAVVLPGFDFDLPDAAWAALGGDRAGEDHPQFRFFRLFERLGADRQAVKLWHDAPPPCPARNRLISLSLRPAPVTDQWLAEGPGLADLAAATAGLTLVEAPSPRIEAETIALRLRQAVADGQTAALITPDRMLTRRVAAALDRWRIVADDSAGQPLALSAPGRFLRHVGGLLDGVLTGAALLALLKHPLTCSGGDRGDHLRRTRDLELDLRRNGPPFPVGATIRARGGGWADWLALLLDDRPEPGPRPLAAYLTSHLALAGELAAGPEQTGAGGLWDEAAGRKAFEVCETLGRHADAGGIMSAHDYLNLFASVLNGAEVRNPDVGHPQVRFWGTLEARVQGADLVILGGMNEGVWPSAPAPDPWLNRRMRQQAGLLLPERRIGLSAHDYQQAVAGAEVWISRAIRSDEAETVPSRWVNRLVNLLAGLPNNGGPAALNRMRADGQRWIAMAQAVGAPDSAVDPAPRPSPCPPVIARPKDLSVTQVQTLIRDPYAIYAHTTLRLQPLDPLKPAADALLRGEVIHKVLEDFMRGGIAPDAPEARATLLQIGADHLADVCPWPTMQRMWLARIDRFADWFLDSENARQQLALPTYYEEWGDIVLDALDFRLKGKADRIDRATDGSVFLYDYKTGAASSPDAQRWFDKQLLLEAAMLARGAFRSVGAATAQGAAFISLGSPPKEVAAPLADAPPELEWTNFHALIRAWAQVERGYSARLAMAMSKWGSDYDHLSRFGEWDETTPVTPVILT